MIRFAFLIPFLLCACGTAAPHFIATDLNQEVSANTDIGSHVGKARTTLAKAIHDAPRVNDVALRTSLTLQLRDTDNELAQAQSVIDFQKVSLTVKQKEIDQQTESANKVGAEKDYWQRKAGDSVWLLWKWRLLFFGLLAIVIALRVFKTYLLSIPVIGPYIAAIL